MNGSATARRRRERGTLIFDNTPRASASTAPM
jgi:hypothetical protein